MCKSCIVPSVKFIGVFYYTLANLHPALRSTHRSIQLITVITHPLLKKYGFPEVKVGVGFALRKCRVCLATDDMIQTKVVVCISIHPIDSFYSLMNLISH